MNIGHTWVGRVGAAVGLVMVATFASAGIAAADDIYNTLDASIDATAESMSLTAGGSNGTTTLKVDPANGDGKNGCNLTSDSTLKVKMNSSVAAVATASLNDDTFTSCGDIKTVTVRPLAAGSTTFTVSAVSNGTDGSFNFAPATFTVTVAPAAPTNTAPVVTVTGVSNNATYEAGAVPTAGCSVVDAEDTGESATPVTTAGASNHHGLGTFTTTCSYTDNGPGTPLTGSASADYTVVDTVKPTIGHTLTPANPNGSNGWYKSPVDVDFACSDGGSGIQSCTGDTTLGNGASQSVTGIATDWAGNTASDPVTGINVDGLAPNAPTASLSPAANPAGWNNTSVTVSFSSNGDNGASGVASCTTAVPVTAETGGQVVSGTCTDRAGNTSAPTAVTVKLDKTGPVISETVTVDGTPGNAGWYTSPVTVTFSGSDVLAGPASQTKQATSEGDGAAVEVVSPAFTDVAGNTTDAGAVTKTYKVDTVAPSVKAPVITGGTLGSNGWYKSAVTASFTATDGTSGVAGTNPQTVTSTTQGTGIVLSSPAFSDVAGNTTGAGATKTAALKIDSLDPNAPTATVNPAPNGAGWNKDDLIVSFAPNGDSGDNGSGVASCTADVPVTAETVAAGQIVSGTCTDEAGNVSEATEVTVKLDRTKPVISEVVTVDGDEGNGDWYTSDVEVTFIGTDALSGPASATQEVTSSGQGSAVPVQSPAFTDAAGNSSDVGAVTKLFQIDKEAPTVGNAVVTSGTLGNNNWYRSAVTVSFTATDNVSGVAGTNPKTVTSSAQGTGIKLESPEFSDVAGNNTTAGNKFTTVKVDSLAPNAPTATVNPAPNGDGWNKDDLVVSFAPNGDSGDNGSGVASCTADVPVTAETVAAGQIVPGRCTDVAGNTSSATEVTVKLDKHGPVVGYASAAGTTGENGWYRSPVEVTFTGNDALSGPASATKKVSSVGDGPAVDVVSPAFTDVAGNTTGAGAVTKTYKIDTVAPSVGDPVLTGTKGDNDWYRSAVTASFTATDATSGVAGTNPKTVTSSTQGTGIVLSSPAFSDVAGNTREAGAKSATVKVDSSAPSVSLLYGPAAGSSYYFGSVPAAPTCGASDATPGSGLADADSPATGVQDCVVTGYSTAVGTHTVTATAIDNAGNTSTDTRIYTVSAWTVDGFYAPVDKGIHNLVKGGATVPLKFELFAGKTELTDVTAVKSFVANKVTCDTTLESDVVESTSSLATSLRYDATGGQFIQNWKTPTGAGSCYRVTMTALDGTPISTLFKTK